jgi:MarR family
MSVNALTWAWDQETGHQIDKAVLMCLADWSSDHGEGQEVCSHAQKALARRVECSLKTVTRSLSRLEKKGFIKRKPRYSAEPDGGRLSELIILALDRGLRDNLSSKGLRDNLSVVKGQFDPPRELDSTVVIKGVAGARSKKLNEGVRS